MKTLIQAFRTKELRNKILFVFAMIIIYRIGSFIPIPGVDYKVIRACTAKLASSSENFIGLVNLFSAAVYFCIGRYALYYGVYCYSAA